MCLETPATGIKVKAEEIEKVDRGGGNLEAMADSLKHSGFKMRVAYILDERSRAGLRSRRKPGVSVSNTNGNLGDKPGMNEKWPTTKPASSTTRRSIFALYISV
jgi:hypothetical protein